MLLHCTRKLAAKMPAISSAPLVEKSPLGSWHANLVQVKHRQCVLFCHDLTRYMLFVPGLKKPHFEDLGRIFRDVFLMSLVSHGLTDAKIMRVSLALGPPAFDGNTNRSVLGAMNIAMQDLEGYLVTCQDLLEIDLAGAALYLNERPTSVQGNWIWPTQEMLDRVAAL